jgi:integrase
MTYWEITIKTASAGIELLAEKLTSGGFEDLVFTTENGKPHYDSNVRSKMHRIVTKMQKQGYDLPDFTPHTLRHSFATRCLENGMNPKTLQRVLGHSTFAITMDTYCDVMDNTIDAEMELVARAL